MSIQHLEQIVDRYLSQGNPPEPIYKIKYVHHLNFHTNTYKGSVFPDTICLWSNLPINVLDQPSLKGFMSALDGCY